MKFNEIDVELVSDFIKSGSQSIIVTCNYLREINKDLTHNFNLGDKCLTLAKGGDIKAMFTISEIYSFGIMCKQNKEQALYWCKKSAEGGCYLSFLALADFYTLGWAGLNVNYSKSIQLIKKAALNNYAPAITMMGLCYQSGEIVNKDIQKAIKYFKQAANLGDEMSMWFLSISLLQSNNTEIQDEGIYWLKKSAKNKCPFAHNTLAYFNLDGVHGFEKNRSRYKYHLDMESSLKEKLVAHCLDGLF